MDWESISKEADAFAKAQTAKYGAPSPLNYNTSNEKGQILATQLEADKNIVLLGTMLMDCKLGQALTENRVQDHVEMSVQAAKNFLKNFEIADDDKQKIINCIEAHHGGPYTCKEAEICANADCYRFLLPKNVFSFVARLIKNEDLLVEQALKIAKEKLEEKHAILSLQICKDELEDYYQHFKALFATVP